MTRASGTAGPGQERGRDGAEAAGSGSAERTRRAGHEQQIHVPALHAVVRGHGYSVPRRQRL